MRSQKPVTAERVERAILNLAHFHDLHPDKADFLLLDALESALERLKLEEERNREERFSKYLLKRERHTATQSP